MQDAVAIVIKRNGKFLLIKRAKKGEAEDYWCPITGAVEKDESQKQAAVREADEEMGIIVKPIKKIWECLTDDKAYRLHWWYVKLLDDTVKMNTQEVKDYCWLDIDEMQKIGKMFDADLQFFKEIGFGLV